MLGVGSPAYLRTRVCGPSCACRYVCTHLHRRVFVWAVLVLVLRTHVLALGLRVHVYMLGARSRVHTCAHVSVHVCVSVCLCLWGVGSREPRILSLVALPPPSSWYLYSLGLCSETRSLDERLPEEGRGRCPVLTSLDYTLSPLRSGSWCSTGSQIWAQNLASTRCFDLVTSRR